MKSVQEEIKGLHEKLKQDPEFLGFCSLRDIEYPEWLEKLYSLELYKNAKSYEKGTILKSSLFNFYHNHNRLTEGCELKDEDVSKLKPLCESEHPPSEGISEKSFEEMNKYLEEFYKERIPLTPYIPIRSIPQLIKEKKMSINNMYESIYIIYDTLQSELDRQGVDDESINKVMDDLLESMNRNIKWTLNKGK